MQQRHNILIFSLLICFLTKTNAQITPGDSIFSSIKDQPYNLLFPYIPNKKFYDINNLSLISKNYKPLVGLDSVITKKEADKLSAKLKKEKELECTKPDKARIEAQKIAEEKLKSKTSIHN